MTGPRHTRHYPKPEPQPPENGADLVAFLQLGRRVAQMRRRHPTALRIEVYGAADAPLEKLRVVAVSVTLEERG